MVRALPCHGRSCGFEPRLPRVKQKGPNRFDLGLFVFRVGRETQTALRFVRGREFISVEPEKNRRPGSKTESLRLSLYERAPALWRSAQGSEKGARGKRAISPCPPFFSLYYCFSLPIILL